MAEAMTCPLCRRVSEYKLKADELEAAAAEVRFQEGYSAPEAWYMEAEADSLWECAADLAAHVCPAS